MFSICFFHFFSEKSQPRDRLPQDMPPEERQPEATKNSLVRPKVHLSKIQRMVKTSKDYPNPDQLYWWLLSYVSKGQISFFGKIVLLKVAPDVNSGSCSGSRRGVRPLYGPRAFRSVLKSWKSSQLGMNSWIWGDELQGELDLATAESGQLSSQCSLSTSMPLYMKPDMNMDEKVLGCLAARWSWSYR